MKLPSPKGSLYVPAAPPVGGRSAKTPTAAWRKVERLLPGLRVARTYRREWLRNDVLAGLSVAAVAIPVGIAYAQLAGFASVAGLYSCILPPVAYALFGSSRQLVVNPDSAVCAIMAATVAPLAAGDVARYADLSLALTLFAGALCITCGLARLGAVANFLSRPILKGYMNGIAFSIIVSQLGALFGIRLVSEGFFHRLAEVSTRLSESHVPTFATGLTLLVMLLVLRRAAPRVPGPLVASVVGVAAVYALGLEGRGVAVVGSIPAGFPSPRLPEVSAGELLKLAPGACTVVLVSFCSMMPTARGFASKNGYVIRPNQDFVALGAANLASAFCRGFAVSGADSRTAVADAAGGRTQAASLVAAAAMSFVLLFLTAPLSRLPAAALAAILIASALGLLDLGELRGYYRVSKPEFRHAVVAMLGVMTLGVLPGVLIAVGLAIFKLLALASRPQDALLGLSGDGNGDAYAVEVEDGGRALDGLVIYRFNAAIVFFNADHFKERVRALVNASGERPRWFLFDASATAFLDVTGAEMLKALQAELAACGVVLCVGRARGRFRTMLERTGAAEKIGAAHLFPTISAGARAFLERGRTT